MLPGTRTPSPPLTGGALPIERNRSDVRSDYTRVGLEPTTATPNGRCSAYYANVRLMPGTRTPSPPLTRGALPIEPNNKQELHGTRTACYHAPNLRNPRTGTVDKTTHGILLHLVGITLVSDVYKAFERLFSKFR